MLNSGGHRYVVVDRRTVIVQSLPYSLMMPGWFKISSLCNGSPWPLKMWSVDNGRGRTVLLHYFDGIISCWLNFVYSKFFPRLWGGFRSNFNRWFVTIYRFFFFKARKFSSHPFHSVMFLWLFSVWLVLVVFNYNVLRFNYIFDWWLFTMCRW